MGLEIMVAAAADVTLGDVLERLARTGFPCTLMMIDGQLCAPRAAAPGSWRDVRLKTPSGMVTLVRRPGGVAVVVFGNADPALVEAQRRVAAALEA